MGKSFCPRKVAARFKYFSLKPRRSGWGFEVLDIEMSVPFVSGYLATLMVESRDWPSGCNNNSMAGVRRGYFQGLFSLNFGRFAPVEECKFAPVEECKFVPVFWRKSLLFL